MAQVNTTVGALHDNGGLIVEYIEKARDAGAQLVVFPEMAITGYPTYDLMYEEGFVNENLAVLENAVIPATRGIVAVLGFVEVLEEEDPDEEGEPQRANCAAVVQDGRLVRKVKKTLLPGYDVYNEKRYFKPGAIEEISPVEVEIGGRRLKLGVQVCEDLWSDTYGYNVSKRLAELGAELTVNCSASPYHIGKDRVREGLVFRDIAETGVPMVYVNQVGGQDEVVFDGRSFAVDATGRVGARSPAFEEALTVFDLGDDGNFAVEVPPLDLPLEEEIIRAHVMNLRDYVEKQGVFEGIVVGTSGGIDSAYTMYIASMAVGPDRALSVSMPSKFSSDHSRSDAAKLAENLGVRHVEVPIDDMFEAGLSTFERAFGKTDFGVAEENDQARCRMQVLMKISQKFKYLVCTTGNKSELSVGYWTLYGDGGGGKNVPGDLFKTELYRVARYINRDREIIPWGTIEKPPSAELRPDQKDTDSLPPYEELDEILKHLVEERRSPEKIVRMGHDEATVKKIVRMYKIGEFKRGQMPQGIKIKSKAFGAGRRMPITNHWL